jgi:hypothetical protein
MGLMYQSLMMRVYGAFVEILLTVSCAIWGFHGSKDSSDVVDANVLEDLAASVFILTSLSHSHQILYRM